MTTRYLSRVLRGIDSVFKFRPSQKGAPEDVELDLPVQTVLDVGPYANLGAGKFGVNYGWWVASTSNVHTVVGTLLQTMDLNNAFQNLNGYEAGWNEDELMAWIYRGWATCTLVSPFKTAQIIVQQPASSIGPGGAAAPATRQMILDADATVTMAGAPHIAAAEGEPLMSSSFPIPILNRDDGSNGFLVFGSEADATGIVTIVFNVLFWLGPKGAPPPHV